MRPGRVPRARGAPAGRGVRRRAGDPSRLGAWTGDESAYEDARRHLAATLEALGQVGIDAHGRLGPHDPLQAADEGLREFAADEVVFATSADGENWLEQGVVEEARARYGVPVTHVLAPSA